MDETNPAGRTLDAAAALDPAFTYVKERLFSPYSFEIWLTLGVISLIEEFGNSGGVNLLGGGSGFGRSAAGEGEEEREAVRQALSRALEFVRENPLRTAVIVAVATVLVLLTLYLGARGTFMYLDNVARRKAEFVEPWRRSGRHAMSYYLWRLATGLGCLAALLASAVPAIVVVYRLLVLRTGPDPVAVGGLIVSALLVPVVLLSAGIVGMLLHDFVAPLMYRFGLPGLEAWRLFLRAAGGNVLPIVLYVLLQFVAVSAFVVAAILVYVFTCGYGLLPVFLQTLLQPFLLFARVYPLYVLEGLGPEFRIVEPAPDPWASPPPGDQELGPRR